MRGFITDLNMYMSGYGPDTATDSNDNAEPLQNVLSGKHEQSRVLAARRREPGPLSPAMTESKDKLNCTLFEADLRVFSDVFQNMAYALSERCYRQCATNGYAQFAASNLQRSIEQPTGYRVLPFYTQMREIEAETGCRFNDTFLIEIERAADYAKIWIQTYQSLRNPCADMGINGTSERVEGKKDEARELRQG
ncbi:MAG: hypothetical protein Q9187_005168 [Circinaria calcarea]